TYAAQVKEAGNGNHFIVLTEGKRDDKSGEVKKTKLFVFSEDFPAFFRLLKDTAEFIKANPVTDQVKQKRQKFWARQGAASPGTPPAVGAATQNATAEARSREGMARREKDK
ncbi:MAG: DUF3276 family protein, partial [Verrucomicrobiota bacterium]|nr:DUF3276 family protein [Verrucomicrobiota bacterium]